MLTLAQALLIAQTALDAGERHGFAPLCIAVLDPGGHPLALLRSERAGIARAEIATAKAAGCLGLGIGGRGLAKRAAAMPALYAQFGQIFPHGLVPVAGGVLVRDSAGALIGAVGISGDTADNDETCALAGIAAAGLGADTGA